MSVYRPRKKDGTFASPFFHYDFQRHGRRFYGSTGETSKRAAEQVERLRRAEAPRIIGDSTIETAFLRFWQETGQYDRDPSTTFERMERLQSDLGGVLAGLGRAADLAFIDEDVLARYVSGRRASISRRGVPPASATINRELETLRRIMRRAVRSWKLQLDLPDWSTALLVEPEEHVVDIPPDVEDKMLAALRPEFGIAFRFLIMTGLRVGSVLVPERGEGYGPLRPDQVDLHAGVITLVSKSKRPGGKTHRMPITREMMILLANEIGKHPDAVFTYVAARSDRGRVRGKHYPLTYSAFHEAFKKAARSIGLPHLRPHDLRHTAANRTLAATGNLRLTQRQLGHSRITTTQRYTHPDLDDVRKAMEAAHSRRIPEITPEIEAVPLRKRQA